MLTRHHKAVLAMVATPDNKSLVSASADKTGDRPDHMHMHIMLICTHVSTSLPIHPDTSARTTTYGGRAHDTCACSFFRAILLLLTSTRTLVYVYAPAPAVRVWDLGSGYCTATLRGHRGEIHALALTPDGKTIVSGDCVCASVCVCARAHACV